MLLLDLI